MTFCSDEQERKDIISNVEINGNICKIHYLDGSVKNVDYNMDTLKDLEYKVVKQAKDRDKEYNKLNRDSIFNILMWFLDIFSFNMLKGIFNDLLRYLLFIYAILNFCEFLNNRRKLNELKKYRILLNNYKELKDNPDLCKLIEVDSYYRKDKIDIFNIDEFSLYDIKTIEKRLKKISKKKKDY